MRADIEHTQHRLLGALSLPFLRSASKVVIAYHHRLNWDYPDVPFKYLQVSNSKNLWEKHVPCIFRWNRWMFYKKKIYTWSDSSSSVIHLARPEQLRAETGFSGSGTPGAEYGSEASRTVWRVALDFLLFPGRMGFVSAGGRINWWLLLWLVFCQTKHCCVQYVFMDMYSMILLNVQILYHDYIL